MKQAVKILGKAFFIVVLAQISACSTSTGSASSVRNAEQATSQQQGGSDERQRAKIHTELGSLYLQDGRASVALEEARIAVNADSSYAPAYNLLGLVHMVLGENEPAEENFKSALNIAGNDPEINNNYGWFLCKSGREVVSMAYFKVAYRNPLYQVPTRAYTNAGICAIQIKDYAAAESYLNSALRYDPSNTLAIYWAGEVYLRTQRYEEARVRVADLVKMLEPTPEVIWLGLRVERAVGDREAEMRYATQLRRRFQTSPEYQKLIKGQYE